MSNYKEGTLYIGNIVKIIDGKKQTIKENAMLIYNKQKDMFTTIEELNNLLDIELNANLDDKTREELISSINKNTYHYTRDEEQYETYIDEDTIEEFHKRRKK